MKRLVLLACVGLVCVGFANQKAHPYRVAFDLTSRDTLDQKAVIRWVKEVTAANPNAQVEVVMYGKGFELVMPERSSLTADVLEALKNKNVAFKVCEVAMKNNGVVKSQLAAGVQTVPDGIYELVSKQQDGWGYIKAVH